MGTHDEKKHCVPCHSGMGALPAEEIKERTIQTQGWDLVDDKKLVREYRFKTFRDALAGANKVADLAEAEGHHPTITINYNKLRLTLTTHAAGGLTENDFIMAKLITEIFLDIFKNG